MNLEELQALFADMMSKGWHPMLCDTEVPLYGSPVACGEPTMSHGDIVESQLLPKELLSMHPEFLVPVRGDSMKDADIVTGDVVRVMGDVKPYDGDIVLAFIDGEYTLKAYCVDEEGQHWLVPQNDKYQPILLDKELDVRIYGRVIEVLKKAPRVPYRQCMKAIKKMKSDKVVKPPISRKRVGEVIREIAPMVTVGRHWYAVFRPMADPDVKAVGESDYDTFCTMVAEEVPDHKHLPSSIELQRLATLSFKKPVPLWRADNAPVKGSRFRKYKEIGERTMEMLKC